MDPHGINLFNLMHKLVFINYAFISSHCSMNCTILSIVLPPGTDSMMRLSGKQL